LGKQQGAVSYAYHHEQRLNRDPYPHDCTECDWECTEGVDDERINPRGRHPPPEASSHVPIHTRSVHHCAVLLETGFHCGHSLLFSPVLTGALEHNPPGVIVGTASASNVDDAHAAELLQNGVVRYGLANHVNEPVFAGILGRDDRQVNMQLRQEIHSEQRIDSAFPAIGGIRRRRNRRNISERPAVQVVRAVSLKYSCF
jgi:hypothetical protein